MEIAPTFVVWHPVIEKVHVGEDIGVSHHNSLGMAGRAARVNESQNCFRVIKGIRTLTVRNG